MIATATLADFQRCFGRHLRDGRAALPSGIDRQRAAVYRELLGNNVRSFVDACFPVARACLGERRWSALCRGFFREWPGRSPWFRDIPREFVEYLTQACRRPLPPWLAELAGYEWAELAVETHAAPLATRTPPCDVLESRLGLDPTMRRLACAWPVHRIGPDWRPRKPQATGLLVYRGIAGRAAFAEAGPATFALLDLLDTASQTGRSALQHLAERLGRPADPALLASGADTLRALADLGIVIEDPS